MHTLNMTKQDLLPPGAQDELYDLVLSTSRTQNTLPALRKLEQPG